MISGDAASPHAKRNDSNHDDDDDHDDNADEDDNDD